MLASPVSSRADRRARHWWHTTDQRAQIFYKNRGRVALRSRRCLLPQLPERTKRERPHKGRSVVAIPITESWAGLYPLDSGPDRGLIRSTAGRLLNGAQPGRRARQRTRALCTGQAGCGGRDRARAYDPAAVSDPALTAMPACGFPARGAPEAVKLLVSPNPASGYPTATGLSGQQVTVTSNPVRDPDGRTTGPSVGTTPTASRDPCARTGRGPHQPCSAASYPVRPPRQGTG